MSKSFVRLILSASALGVLAILIVGALTFGSGHAVTTKTIHVGDQNNNSLNDRQGECDGTITQWHFVINGITGAKPATIHVTWDDGSEEDVSVDPQQGGSSTAHYTTTLHAGHLVTDATAVIESTWSGEFVLSDVVCEEKLTPDITTTIHDADHNPITEQFVGEEVHDSAVVSGGIGDPVPTGTVTFTWWDNGNCDGEGSDAGTVTLDEFGVADPSDPETVTESGGSFKAHYNGDENYLEADDDVCEVLAVEPALLPDVTTEVHLDGNEDDNQDGQTLPLGSSVHDQATVAVTGADIPDGSNVTFKFFAGDDCTGDQIGDDEVVSLDGGSDLESKESSSSGPLGAGSYSYLASFTSGDTDIVESGDALCETVEILKGELSISTEAHDSDHNDITNGNVPLGSVTHDTAQVTGAVDGFDPGVTVQFALATNSDCEDGTNIDNDGAEGDDPRSVDSDALGAGDYAYSAGISDYDSDNYELANDGISDCEPFTVDKGELSISTEAHDSDHNDITNGNVPLGSVTHDTAQVTGAVDGFDPGVTVQFALATNSDCEDGSNIDNDGAEGDDPRSVDSDALGAGNYAYSASISDYDSDNYNLVDDGLSDCEPFTVDKGDVKVSTIIHNAQHQAVLTVSNGAIVHDTATLGGLDPNFNPRLVRIQFQFFTNGDCTEAAGGPPWVAPSGPESSDTARSADSAPLTPGSYSYRARFLGDTNYNAAGPSDCEPLTVRAVLGKTKGFWGNRNGQALIASNFTYQLGGAGSLCRVAVTKANSTTVLPNSNNGLSISTNCTPLDAGLSTGAVNNLLGQVLALRLNQLYIAGYGANTIGTLSCTGYVGGTGLTAASTIQDVLNYANGVIGNLKSGGVVVTSTKVGDLNALLGDCMNREV